MSKQTVYVEIGGVSTLARLTIWYYFFKFLWALVCGTVKYAIVLLAVAVAVAVLGWCFTAPPRPYELDRLSPYLVPVSEFLKYDHPNLIEAKEITIPHEDVPGPGFIAPLPRRDD